MLVKYRSDITEVERGIILNGVNCQHRMGSGLAKAIYTKWPIVRQMYMKHPAELGRAILIQVEHGLWVANCYTQKFYGFDGKSMLQWQQ